MSGDGDRDIGCQIITQELEFNSEFATYVEQKGFGAEEGKFHVVSIIGGQSSGKSTLLNKMFGTSFEMMDSKKGRKQTTKGIWCSRSQKGGILVMDVEGTDGREKEDQKVFEGKSALFSLALTDVMLVNMWTQEVGRFNAANLPLLRTVFEVHLRLMHGDSEKAPDANTSKPLLLFILRDWDGSTPVEALKETIQEDLTKIWTDMKKPEKLSSSEFLQFFELEVEPLPHFVYEKAKWQEKVEEVSSRFLEPSSETYVFKNRGQKDVPADGFSLYASNLWEAIEKDGELDLPTQRKMLSMVRCETRRRFRFEEFANTCKDWSQTLKKDNFKKTADEHMGDLIKKFRKDVHGYDPDVCEETVSRLKDNAFPLLQDSFDSFVRTIREDAEKDGSRNLEALLPEKGVLPESGFSRRCKEVEDRIQDTFNREIEELIPEGAPWKQKLEEPEGASVLLKQHLQRESSSVKKQLHGQVRLACEEFLKKSLSKDLVLILDRAESAMWESIRSSHSTCIGNALNKMKSILQDVGMWEASKEKSYQEGLRECADTLVHDKVEYKAEEASIGDKMFQKFDMQYNRNHTRTWRLWDNPEQEFEKAKAIGLMLLEVFTESCLYEEGQWPSGLTAITFISEDRGAKLRQQYDEKILPELPWAQANKANSSTQRTLMISGLVLVLGWNEIMFLLYNPLYLMLLIMGSGGGIAYYFVQKVGTWQQLVVVVLQQLQGTGGGGTGLEHAQHLAGPPGRDKRPMSAPVVYQSSGSDKKSS